jgi:hypothetical protein
MIESIRTLSVAIRWSQSVLTLSSLRDRLSVARIAFSKLEQMVLACYVYSSSGIFIVIPVDIQF